MLGADQPEQRGLGVEGVIYGLGGHLPPVDHDTGGGTVANDDPLDLGLGEDLGAALLRDGRDRVHQGAHAADGHLVGLGRDEVEAAPERGPRRHRPSPADVVGHVGQVALGAVGHEPVLVKKQLWARL